MTTMDATSPHQKSDSPHQNAVHVSCIMSMSIVKSVLRFRSAAGLGKKKIEWGREKKCRNPGLNQGPSDLQSDALPTELFRQT